MFCGSLISGTELDRDARFQIRMPFRSNELEADCDRGVNLPFMPPAGLDALLTEEL